MSRTWALADRGIVLVLMRIQLRRGLGLLCGIGKACESVPMLTPRPYRLCCIKKSPESGSGSPGGLKRAGRATADELDAGGGHCAGGEWARIRGQPHHLHPHLRPHLQPVTHLGRPSPTYARTHPPARFSHPPSPAALQPWVAGLSNSSR